MGDDLSSAPRVRLRRLEAADLDALHLLLSNWNVVRYMLLPLCSREESEKFLRDAMDEEASPAWRSVVRAFVDAESGRLVGLGGVVILRGTEEGELWYLLDPACWGRGLGACCAGQLVALGFGELQLHRVWATSLPENPASGRVLERTGMRQEGFLRKHLKIHGEWKDCFLYAILREEWESQQRSPAS
ncbi:MAG: GNAT family protein [Bryobacteraceae bacterium]|jgi:RimJ/RimL family protein N-acetyltransferase